MLIDLNGEPIEVDEDSRLSDAVARLVGDATGHAVARNGEVVPRSFWAGCTLEAGDRIEVLGAAPGG